MPESLAEWHVLVVLVEPQATADGDLIVPDEIRRR
jgi:hypothetical protein